jgi:hypothetical protein
VTPEKIKKLTTRLEGQAVIRIDDVWGKRNQLSAIVVSTILRGRACGYPYSDSSERRDQLRNAREFAAGLAKTFKATIEDRIL